MASVGVVVRLDARRTLLVLHQCNAHALVQR